MLIGEYTHTLDDKNRVSIPSKFRKELGKTVIITHGLDSCLFVYSVDEWAKISEQLSGLGFAHSHSRSLARFIMASASEVTVDKSGRILLPEHLVGFAGISDKAVFAGVHSRVEIWGESSWSSYKGDISKEADKIAEQLGEVGLL